MNTVAARRGGRGDEDVDLGGGWWIDGGSAGGGGSRKCLPSGLGLSTQ